MAIECVICKKGQTQVEVLHRINAKGQPGLWACEKHVKQTDAPPMAPEVREIIDALKPRNRP